MNHPETNPRFRPNVTPCGRTRREFLWQVGGGFAGLGLLDLLSRDGFFAGSAKAADAAKKNPQLLLAPKPPHFATKAKHCIFLFMNGAPSQVDTFDPKPALAKYHGKPYNGKVKVGSNGRPIGYLMQSPFEFKKHGQSGLEISSLFPHTAKHADRLCVLRSLYTDTAAHASGCLQMNTGNVLIGKPALGAWLSYGLGTSNESLPSFVVMTDPRGGAFWQTTVLMAMAGLADRGLEQRWIALHRGQVESRVSRAGNRRLRQVLDLSDPTEASSVGFSSRRLFQG